MNSSEMDLGESVIFSTSPTGIPNQTLLDHYHTCITRKFGMPLETLHQATCQNTTISQVSGPTSICSNAVVIHTSTRIIQHTGHLQVWWVHHNFCHTITEFQPTTDVYTMQKKFTAFSWRCPQLAHGNCHHKRHPQHQNMDKPTHCHADITMQHPGPYCVNLEHHKIHHTG